MHSKASTLISERSWTNWPLDAKLELLARLQTERWLWQTLEPRDRQEQREPAGDWRAWYLRGGRGSGKTRTGSETLAAWIRRYCLGSNAGDWAIVAPTFGDARDTCMEGPSGLLPALAGLVDTRKDWNRSHGELWLPNGSRVYCDGADDGALRIQGKNLRGAWCDEVGLWVDWHTAWNESLAFAVRLEPGKIVATGTPKMGHPLVKLLLDDPRVAKTHMRMVDNIDNLHPAAVEDLRRRYEGTRIGRQELEGEFLEDVEGTLWTRELIEQARQERGDWGHLWENGSPLELSRCVVAVDPSGSSKQSANAAGIVIAASSKTTGRAYVFEDRTTHGSPMAWATAAVTAYHAHDADRIVAESNYGGEMVEATIRTVDPSVPVRLVHASRGKQLRAEPVAAQYEKGNVKHVGVFPELEDEMCTWTPESSASPNRLDALVWAITDLLLAQREAGQLDYRPNGKPHVYQRGDLVLVGPQYEDK